MKDSFLQNIHMMYNTHILDKMNNCEGLGLIGTLEVVTAKNKDETNESNVESKEKKPGDLQKEMFYSKLIELLHKYFNGQSGGSKDLSPLDKLKEKIRARIRDIKPR